jgi:dTDP-4-amino-4,6-dideoxygalactose transaminase
MSDDPIQIFDDAELEALRAVVESQSAGRGMGEDSPVTQFEDAFGERLGRKYVLALSSGTAANEAALAGIGIGPGDEVICPPCTFIASSMSALTLGAVPVFADVDPRTLIITAESIEAAVTAKAKAVVVVHLNGQPAEMAPILEVARKYDLAVVEDCAQAFDCMYRDRPVGAFGSAASFSLQQGKQITCGEGGIVVTDDPEVYERASLYCNCGMAWYRYGLEAPNAEPVGDLMTRGHFAMGHNYRMTAWQGAVAFAQLGKMDRFNARRAELVDILENTLADLSNLQLAHRYVDTSPIYWNYPLRTIGITTREIEAACRERKASIRRDIEINYLEAVYQQMEAERCTPVGVPLPDYVHYRVGVCPEAEEAARYTTPVFVHHGMIDPDKLREWATALRGVLTGLQG